MDVYIITETWDGWRLDHPWSVTGTLKDAMPEVSASLWDLIRIAERMEREGARFRQEVE
jgi:hypothetical protein